MVLLNVTIFFLRYLIFPVIGAIGTGAIFAAKGQRDTNAGARLGLYLAVLAGYVPLLSTWRIGDPLAFPLPPIPTWGALPLGLVFWILPLIAVWILVFILLPEGDADKAYDGTPDIVGLLLRGLDSFQWVDAVIDVLRILIIELVIVGSFNTLLTQRISGEQWIDLFVAGLAQGSIYALIALGYTLVYGILLMINFAHGEVYMAGAFTTVFLAQYFDRIGFLNGTLVLGPIDFPLAIPAILMLLVFSALVSMTVAVLLERLAYRPLRGSPRLVPLITAIGASFFLQYTFRGFYGSGFKSYPNVDILAGSLAFGTFDVPKVRIAVFVAALMLMGGLFLLVERTKIGKAMRAVSEDKEVARLMGINIDYVIMFTFALGGLLAGAAGVINGLFRPQGVNFFMGFRPGIKAFTAAVLGGIGSVPGAMLGGLFLGVIEAVGPNLVLAGLGIEGPNQLQDVIAFTMLVLVLIFRPQGIIGERLTEKKA